MTPDGSTRKPGLSRESLVRAALAIVDREGLPRLSMRRLGAELGVDAMAAYRHFSDKEALLDGVVEAVVSEVDVATDASLPWTEQVRQLARAYRFALLAHPATAPLIASRPLATPGSLRMTERALQLMADAGVAPHRAIVAVNTIGILITGIVVVETSSAHPSEDARRQLDTLAALSPSEFPQLGALVASGGIVATYDEMVEAGLSAIIGALRP